MFSSKHIKLLYRFMGQKPFPLSSPSAPTKIFNNTFQLQCPPYISTISILSPYFKLTDMEMLKIKTYNAVSIRAVLKSQRFVSGAMHIGYNFGLNQINKMLYWKGDVVLQINNEKGELSMTKINEKIVQNQRKSYRKTNVKDNEMINFKINSEKGNINFNMRLQQYLNMKSVIKSSMFSLYALDSTYQQNLNYLLQKYEKGGIQQAKQLTEEQAFTL